LCEQREDQLASLGWLWLCVPEAREVFEERLRAVEVWVGWRCSALQLLLEGLAAHDVLGLGEIAHDVKVAQPLQLGAQLAAAVLIFAWVYAGLGLDGVEDEPAQLGVGLSRPLSLLAGARAEQNSSGISRPVGGRSRSFAYAAVGERSHAALARDLSERHNGSMTDQDSFARLRLTGGRFDGHGMPVETLVELAQYRELVLGVARARFLREHPERQRVPRGFVDRLQLRLQTVEEGSAMPVLERVVPPGALMAVEDDFTRARDAIEEAVAAAEKGAPPPEGFPPEALVLFNRFGQTLRADEAIELRRGAAKTGPRYTPETRRRLVLSQRRTYQEEVHGIGWISEVDGNGMSCRIRLRMGPAGSVPAPLDEVTFGPVKDVLEPNGEGPPVRVSGIGVFDSERGLIRFDSIHDVNVIDDPDDLISLDNRLDELASLDPGWLDGDGLRPDALVLMRARRILADLLAFEVPRPRVFATPEGGVQAEWTIDDHEISVTFEPDGKLYAVSVNLISGDADEPTMATDDLEQIAQLLQVS
jgi:hypothetical protein